VQILVQVLVQTLVQTLGQNNNVMQILMHHTATIPEVYNIPDVRKELVYFVGIDDSIGLR